jgi:hypothetical protein
MKGLCIMATKQGRGKTSLADKPAARVTAPKDASPKAERSGAARQKTGTTKSSALVRSFAIRSDQFENLTSLSAYNKLKRIQPDSVSAIVRDAIDGYLAKADGAFREFMPKGDDETG